MFVGNLNCSTPSSGLIATHSCMCGAYSGAVTPSGVSAIICSYWCSVGRCELLRHLSTLGFRVRVRVRV